MRIRAPFILRYACVLGMISVSLTTVLSQNERSKEIDSLFHLQDEFMAEQKFSEAMAVLESLSVILEAQEGDPGLMHARLANARGKIHEKNAAYPDAEVEYRKALGIQEVILGEEDLDYAETVNNLGISLMFQERFEEARESYLKAGNIRKNILGEHHPDYARSLNNVANTYLYQGDFAQAEAQYLKANEIREKSSGPNTEQYAGTLMNLASLYLYQGRANRAADFIDQACSTYKNTLGDGHIKYAICLSNLGNVQNSLAEYDQSAENYRKAEMIFHRHLPSEHPDILLCKEGQIASYQHKGYLELYRDKTMEILEVRRRTLGENHTEYLNSLANVIQIFQELGELDKSETYIQQLVTTRILKLGEDHPNTLEAEMIKSSFLSSIGDLEEAIRIDEKVITKYKNLESASPFVLAQYYDKLSHHLLNNLQPARADSFSRMAVEIYTRQEDGDVFSLIQAMEHLAMANARMGRYQEARSWFEKSIEKSINQVGEWSPATITKKANYLMMLHRSGELADADVLVNSLVEYLSRTNLTDFETRNYLIGVLLTHSHITKDYSNVYAYAQELYQSQVQRMNRGFSHLSDAERENFIQNQLGPHLGSIALLAARAGNNELNAIVYDMALVMKGAQLRSRKNTLLYILQQEDEESYVQYAKLMGVRRALAAAYVDSDYDPAKLNQLEQQQSELEKELARRSSTYRTSADSKGLTHQEIQKQLQSGEAAVEFILYPEESDRANPVYRYGALVMKWNEPGVDFVDLCSESDLEDVLSSGSEDGNHHLATLYTARGLQPEKRLSTSRELYPLIFQPLEQVLSSIQTIHYSPVGLLHRLNLGAVPIDRQGYAMDRYQFNRMSSTGMIAHKNQPEQITSEDLAIVVGGIDYDEATEVISDASISETLSDAIRGPIQSGIHRGNVGQKGWAFLEGTLEESEQIREIMESAELKCTVYSGKDATEDRIKKLGRSGRLGRVLHVASHGYFFPDPKGHEQVYQHQFSMSDHPMIRSGLILSGANRVWLGGEQPSEQEDGVLTALEISQMNLTRTELVVLSACETGLGDIRGEEGVYGLQRAFKIAGAKYLIMSLWQVPDHETKEFMTTFYHNWLGAHDARKMTIPDAFRKTQQEMKERFGDPYSWAGFVLVE